ncbi:MAG: prephenate dehydratase [Syntrophomonadaceae bacterium]|nr:prephenate dehydratase [Syntrophomonadaceae bacterium]MDD3024442.1 prephenate dehydratase [Syntrophomonadaceae bacterium]
MAYAILGPSGTFSEEAARLYWGDDAELSLIPNIAELFQRLENGQAEGALIPIDNSLAGTINVSMECLEASCVNIKGEITIPITQHLMAGSKYQLDEIELLISQPAALLQCEGFIRNNLAGVRREITDSTTAAAQIIRGEKKRAACIGNWQASRLYELEIIESNIQDEDNLTRFIHVAAGEAIPGIGEKSSIIFTLPDYPGALYKALGIFASRNLNLSKIESQPARDRNASFSFYTEVDTPGNVLLLEQVLSALKQICTNVKYLGSYNEAKRCCPLLKRSDTY